MTDEVNNTEVDNDQSASFDERLLDNLDAAEPEQEAVETAEPETVEEAIEALEPPEFFSKEHKEYFQKLQDLEGGREYAEQWHGQWKENQSYITKKSQELADERRQYENQLNEYNQYQQAIQPINEIWQRQGIAPAVGMAQMAYYGKLLHTDPKALIQEVADFAGMDLNQVVEEQPYVDPHLQERFRTLEQQNQQLQQTIGQFQQGQQVNQSNAINQQIQEFANAEDNGQKLHPFFDDVQQDMITLLSTPDNGVNDLDTAYKYATQYNPDIQKKLQAEQEKEQAAARQAEAQKAKAASVQTNSKSKDAPKVTPSFDDRLKANLGIS